MSDPEKASTQSTEEAPFGYLFPAGLMPLLYISAERMRQIREAEERRAEKDKPKPPKPPRRPNARIGAVALGNT